MQVSCGYQQVSLYLILFPYQVALITVEMRQFMKLLVVTMVIIIRRAALKLINIKLFQNKEKQLIAIGNNKGKNKKDEQKQARKSKLKNFNKNKNLDSQDSNNKVIRIKIYRLLMNLQLLSMTTRQ